MAEALRSPYRGLTPYAEDDWAYFFGRDEDVDRLAAYLGSSTLTVLYGASGVGKSSLLRAGLEHRLLEEGRQNVTETGSPRVVVCVVREWLQDPSATVLESVADAWRATGAKMPSIRKGGFTEVLDGWAEQAGGCVYLILDQFEEYLLYHGQDGGVGEFGQELARLANDGRSRVSVVLSLREDAVAQLDRFKRLVPSLLDKYLRVDHLTFAGARKAITCPLGVYRKRVAEEGPTSVDPTLVETILHEVRAGSAERIEAPYLQLIMRRLWQHALEAGAATIEGDALTKLGGAGRVVRGHIDEAMGQLSVAEQDAAAKIFHQLITPSGSKIAHAIEDLATWSGLPESALTPMLRKLSEGETRILRSVPPPLDRPLSSSYELFHDVLARPVLDWCNAHERALADTQRTRAWSEPPQAQWSGEADGVFGASGIRLIGLAGALEGFGSHPVFPVSRWANVAGVSGGAIIAALVASGREPDEIRQIVSDTDFPKVIDSGPAIARLPNIIAHGSLSNGKRLEAWLRQLFEDRTFASVKTPDGLGYRLKLIAADVTHAAMLILPDDLPSYRLPGSPDQPIDPDSFPLADALRISMSIPFLYPPIELVHSGTGQEAAIVDGGIFSELPVWLFDLQDRGPSRPTFGVRVRGAKGAGKPLGRRLLGRPMRLALQVFRTASEASDARLMARSARVRTCVIDAGGVGATDFRLPPEQMHLLIESGRAAAGSFLNDFDVSSYVNVFGRTFTSPEPAPA